MSVVITPLKAAPSVHQRHHVTRFLTLTLLALLLFRGMAHYRQLGWEFAAAMAFGLTLLLLAYSLIYQAYFLLRLTGFGLVSGFTELAADCWLVNDTQTLIYAPQEYFIFCSPVYMPFAWAMVLVNIGGLSYYLLHHESRIKAILLTGLLGATVIPLFEHFAKGAGWWWYVNAPMIWDVPFYIILGEGLICLFLGILFNAIAKHKWYWLVLLGIAHGLYIWLSYYVGFLIFDTR